MPSCSLFIPLAVNNLTSSSCTDFAISTSVSLISIICHVRIQGNIFLSIYCVNLSIIKIHECNHLTKPLIQGHRGASAVEPENTIRAFIRAFDDGADGIEFDIRLTADKKIVVIHDKTINRTSNGKGLVKDYTFDELLKFDFGLGERIPLLAEVLTNFGNNYWLNIEVKELGFEQQLVNLLKILNVKEKIVISSFKEKALIDIKKLDRSLCTAFIYNMKNPNLEHLKSSMGIDSIHPKMNLVTKRLVKKADELNLPIRTWTVDQPKDAIKLAKLGIDTIITNNPKVIAQALDRKNE
ncbi:MAG: glycerophosphodiester phosphodiesterase [Asgard group archaeon]|nr:glycerophosphodiester phosphodiesterase [Asgard group archaeon]